LFSLTVFADEGEDVLDDFSAIIPDGVDVKIEDVSSELGLDAILDEIVAAGAVSDAHLRMLVEEIVINEKKGKLKIKIKMRAKFSSHIDFIPDENDPMYQNMSPYLIEV
jgi:hypothetical protein